MDALPVIDVSAPDKGSSAVRAVKWDFFTW